jgi:hypothetical protein
MGIAIDPTGRIYVTDEARADVQAFDADGRFLFRFATSPLLDKVESIEVDLPGNRILVCDEGRSRVNIYGLDGTFQSSFGGPGSGPGQFGNDTNAVRLDGRRRIYVNDQGNMRINVFAADTRFLASFRNTRGGFESADGVALSEAQNLFLVADQGHNRVVAFDLGEIQCRLGRIELGSAAAAAPTALAAGFDAAPVGESTPPWADGILYLEARTLPGDPARVETALVHVRSERDRRGICVPMTETSAASGILRAHVQLGESSDEDSARLATFTTDAVRAHLAGDSVELRFEFASDVAPMATNLAADGRSGEAPRVHDHPQLTWHVVDLARRPTTHYEMRLVTADGAPLWTSGIRTGDANAHVYDGPPLQAGTPYAFQLRVAAGRVWSEWATLHVQRNRPPAVAIATSPLPATRLRHWPPQFVVPMPVDPDGDVLSAHIEVRMPRRTLRSHELAALDHTWLWSPQCPADDNAAMQWRTLVTDGYDTVAGPWTALALDAADEDPLPPQTRAPPAGAVVHSDAIEFTWHAALDPDPDSRLEYVFEWSRDSGFANAIAVPAQPTTRLEWTEPQTDGPLYWRVRARDAGGRSSVSATTHVVLARTARIRLRADTHSGPLQLELGMFPGAADAAGSEDALAAMPAGAPRFASWTGASPPLARDLRAARDVAISPLVFDLTLEGAGTGPVRLHAESVHLPDGWRAALRDAGGRTRASWRAPTDLGGFDLDAMGATHLQLVVSAPQPRPRHEEEAADTALTTTLRKVVRDPLATVSAPITAGTRLRFAAAGAGRTRIRVFDVRGRCVRTDIAGPDGTWTWDGRGAFGQRLPRGVYWIRGHAGHGAPHVGHRVVWAG